MNRKANILVLAPLLALGVCEPSTRAQAASDPVAVIASIYRSIGPCVSANSTRIL
jgi:hypothetical protein